MTDILVDPLGYFFPKRILTTDGLYDHVLKVMDVHLDSFDPLLFHYQALRQRETLPTGMVGFVRDDIFHLDDSDEVFHPLCKWTREHESVYLFENDIVSFVFDKDGERTEVHYQWCKDAKPSE